MTTFAARAWRWARSEARRCGATPVDPRHRGGRSPEARTRSPRRGAPRPDSSVTRHPRARDRDRRDVGAEPNALAELRRHAQRDLGAIPPRPAATPRGRTSRNPSSPTAAAFGVREERRSFAASRPPAPAPPPRRPAPSRQRVHRAKPGRPRTRRRAAPRRDATRGRPDRRWRAARRTAARPARSRRAPRRSRTEIRPRSGGRRRRGRTSSRPRRPCTSMASVRPSSSTRPR